MHGLKKMLAIFARQVAGTGKALSFVTRPRNSRGIQALQTSRATEDHPLAAPFYVI
jgi:hypothetical protein